MDCMDTGHLPDCMTDTEHMRETLTCFGNPAHTSLRSYSQGFYRQKQEKQSLSKSDGLSFWSAWKHWESDDAERGWDRSKQCTAKLHPQYGAKRKKSKEKDMHQTKKKRMYSRKTLHLGQTCHKRRQIGKATYIVQSYGSVDKCKQIKHTSPAVDRQEQQCHLFSFVYCLL